MTIYLDVVFFQNILMNSIILLGSGLVTKTKCKIVKILISSTLGALYVVGIYMSNEEIYSNLLVKTMLSIAMVYIAFTPKSFKLMAKYVLIFYLTSFVFGGCAFALLYYIKPSEILSKNGFYFGTYPIKIAFLGAFLGLAILCISFKIIKNRLTRKDMFCDIEIMYNGHLANIKAIIDTGNLLKDPITGMSVIVVQKSKLEEIIDKNILDNLQDILSGKYEFLGDEYVSKFRLIPFSSLGKQNGMLLGFKPDYITVEFDEIKRTTNKVIIRNI